MTIRRLEDFARSISAAVGLAHRAPGAPGPETRVTSMDVDLAATVERLEPDRHGVRPGTLALRIGRPKGPDAPYLQLSIGVRGERGDDIEVRLEGQLLGRYGSAHDGGNTANGKKT